MIIRIVKLTFQPDKVSEFRKLFQDEQKKIAAFDGCHKVELWQDIESSNVFFTFSEWRDTASLNNYRKSDFFKTTWAEAKKFFAGKPLAWSVRKNES